jgi:predicted DsbA family dithiol-disulfide isomerase
MQVRIDVIFDTVCPWCYIGKHRLEKALARRPEVQAEIRWRPFLLNPEMPAGGVDRQVYLERKFGSIYRIQRVHGAAKQAAAAEGITLNLDAIRRTPNSMNSHRLIHFASGSTRQAELVQAIFHAYFVRGQDIGDIRTLRQIAEDCGLPGREVETYLWSGGGTSIIESDNTRVHRLGVSGVPCFIFEESYAVAGAQEPDMLARLIDIARESEPETASR